jgi:hypothetical protein
VRRARLLATVADQAHEPALAPVVAAPPPPMCACWSPRTTRSTSS